MEIHYNNTSLNIDVNDNSYRYRAIKGEHSLTLYFSLPQHVEIPVGAYCVFEAETYTLEVPENLKMHNSRNFEYTVIFESSQAKAKKYKFRNPVDKRLKFNLTATPREHLQMFVDNMNMRDSGWTIGQCIDAPEKLISYNHEFCIDALTQQADEFKTEYEFNGKQVSLWKVEYNKDNPLPLSYGRGKGFKPGVGRTNFSDSKPIEVLFVQGGDRNIDASKYGSKELLLPKNQTLRYDGKFFEGQVGFNASIARTYISSIDGLSIQRQDKPLRSKEEDSLDLSHIYPSRVGDVTGVEVTKEGFCDFFDSTIPDALDFSTPKSRFKGEMMTVIFQSGQLSGKEFQIQQNENSVIGYIHSERRFKVVEQIIDGFPMPKDIYMPVIGDKYAVFGICLPEAYVCDNITKSGASWDMFREAAKYLYENEDQKFTFAGELDGIWAKKDWLNIGGRIKLGGYILFSDTQFQREGVGIRIVGIKDYINNPHSPEVELSNSVVGSTIMSDLRKIESNEVLTDSQHKESLQFTNRRFRDAQETAKMLEKSLLDNFTNSINPIAVQTMQLILGDVSLQFRFVDNKITPTQVQHQVTYNVDTKILSAQSGILQHLTLEINTLSSSHKASEYKYWDMSAFTSPALTESSKGYYLYAKVSKNDTTGVFYLSEKAIKIEEVTGCYHLLYGILNSEYNNERSFAPMYGFAELTPGRLTVPMIVSADGLTYFDLAKSEIGGRIVFTSNGKEKTLDELGCESLESKDYINNTLKGILSEIQAQLDGQIEQFFDTYDPTTTNAPANTWTTAQLKEEHLDDLFYNTNDGKVFRWVKDGSVYSWKQLQDSEIVQALALANDALVLAKTKRRIFTATPYSPYDIGDLWVNGMDLRRCSTAKAIGESYSINDWVVAVNYDNTQTVIDGGLVTSGTVQVAGDNTSILAGITGQGTAATSVRFWSGASYENRITAPYRVMQDGSVVMTSADIEGKIMATSGKIGYFDIVDKMFLKSGDTMTLSSLQLCFSDKSRKIYIGTSPNESALGLEGPTLAHLEVIKDIPNSGLGETQKISRALFLDAQKLNSIALDIKGKIRMNDMMGTTGYFDIGSGSINSGNYGTIRIHVTNGIITRLQAV